MFILLLAASFAIAQQASRVEGRVVSSTGEPIGKVTVRLIAAVALAGQQATSYVEVTSSDGRFTVENIAPGKYTTSAQRNGYTPTRNPAGGIPVVNFEVAAGETKSGIELRLTPLAVVSGMVTDADGEPLSGVLVALMRYTFNQGKLTLGINPAALNTDDRGAFRLPNVPPGRYYVQASSSVSTTFNEIRGRSALEMNLPTYYPSSLDARGAVAIDVGSTEVPNVRVRMQRGRTYSIHGGVSDPASGQNMQLTVFPKGGAATPLGVTFNTNGAKGTFEIHGLQPGAYTIVVRSTRQAAAAVPPPAISPGPAIAVRPAGAAAATNLSGRLDVNVGTSDLNDVTIRMTEGAEISGRVTIEGGVDLQTFMASMPAAAGPAGPQVRMPNITLLATEGPGAQLAATVNSDGTYRISNIPALNRLLQIAPLPANAYVKSIRFGGLDVTRAPMDLASGTGGVLDIVISDKGAEITATPRTDKGEAPQGGASITIWPRTPNPGSITGDVRFTAPIVSLRAQGLAPGDYYVAAWGTLNTDYLRVPEFLARFTALATKVTLAEGESVAVEPKVISREAVEKEMAQFP